MEDSFLPLASSPDLRTIELVGPPGAGKTTICRELIARDGVADPKPRLGRLRYAPQFTLNAVPLLPMISHRVPRDKLMTVLYLEVLADVLERPKTVDAEVCCFDQGPIYHLATIAGPGPTISVPDHLQGWWNDSLDRWASLLSLVVQLDAPDASLAERIGRREKWHYLKGAPHAMVSSDLARTRALYEDLVTELARRSERLDVARFDTSVQRIGEVVNRLDELTRRDPARSRGR